MKKKLIEVALPLEAINKASAREKSIRHGHPSTLHLWWARRPLAAARAVIFSQMVDDPSGHPELFPTEEAQNKERERLFKLIEDMVVWENSTNEDILNQAREEIWKSWRITCAENREHPEAAKLFNPNKLPEFHDPFAGGGSIPLEAQRLGLISHASDLNPVAVLINKAMIEIPPKFANRPPINPESKKQSSLANGGFPGAKGLAEDVRYYGQWMRDEAEKRIGQFYPKILITPEMTTERPDLLPYLGKELTIIAWLWARTVKSPNPAFNEVHVPLASTFMLSTKAGKEAYIVPVIDGKNYHFTVKVGKPTDPEAAKNGTKLARGANFKCLMSGSPMPHDYVRGEFQGKRNRDVLMAIVAESNRGRVYLSPTSEQEKIARNASPKWFPDQEMNQETSNLVSGRGYGITHWHEIFTPRQLLALTTFSDLVSEARELIKADAIAAGMDDDGLGIDAGGLGAQAYADAVGVYLGLSVSKLSNRTATLSFWNTNRETVEQVFARQALSMTWDFVEGNPFCTSTGNFVGQVEYLIRVIKFTLPATPVGYVYQAAAQNQDISLNNIVSTDPPYYDNIGYADLSDFFYVWLRKALKDVIPNLFATLSAPKTEELVATPYRHGSKEAAETFFLDGMTEAMRKLNDIVHPAFPVTIYYAFKQSESNGDEGISNTGWDTFLDAMIKSGFSICGTLPMRTEHTGALKKNMNALASSIVLVCRKRSPDAPIATRREFLDALGDELPEALRLLQKGNIAPVDLAQAAIGPGMGVFTRYAKVIDAKGEAMTVREALALINQTLDEVLAEQEGDFDADSRWALAWFEQYGFEMGEYGVAETLSKAKNTSVEGIREAGMLVSKGGKVRLLRPEELAVDWDPSTDARLTAWEAVHHMIRVLATGGESAAAELLVKLASHGDSTRELAYRLYTMCERKKRSNEAHAYNALVQSWSEIVKLSKGSVNVKLPKGQTQLQTEDDDE